MTDTVELLPCPLCGDADDFNPSTSKSHRYAEPGNPDAGLVHSGFYVECDKCGCCGPDKPAEAEAIAAWNTRSDRGRGQTFSASGAGDVLNDHIKHMVNRFLMWRLPDHFGPDNGISFTSPYPDEPMRSRHWPLGTNLFGYDQAEAMVRHMIEGMPALSGEGERAKTVDGPNEAGLYEALADMFDDFQTSQAHHPHHVLVQLKAFVRARAHFDHIKISRGDFLSLHDQEKG